MSPYISQVRRSELENIVEELGAKVFADGDLNYILFAFARRFIEPGYGNYKNLLGELNECAEEIRRRLLVPLEEVRIRENGDV